MRILANTNYNFIKWRWHALGLSLVVIGAGLITVLQRGGLPLRIDFSRGTAVVQRYGGAASTNSIMVRLPQAGGQDTNLDADARRIDEAIRASNIGGFT